MEVSPFGWQQMVAVVLGCRMALVNTKWAPNPSFLAQNELRKCSFHFAGASFLALLQAVFSRVQWTRALTIENLLMNGCG